MTGYICTVSQRQRTSNSVELVHRNMFSTMRIVMVSIVPRAGLAQKRKRAETLQKPP
jgi:hypothetical protein